MFFALALLALPAPERSDAAIDLCRPALARAAEGEIQSFSATSIKRSGKSITVTGELTAFLGMGPPQPGSASAHHLIRAEFDFACRVRHGRVREARVKPRS